MNVITNRRHIAFRMLVTCLLPIKIHGWNLHWNSYAKLEGIYHDHRHQQLGNILCDVDFDFCNHDQMRHWLTGLQLPSSQCFTPDSHPKTPLGDIFWILKLSLSLSWSFSSALSIGLTVSSLSSRAAYSNASESPSTFSSSNPIRKSWK